MDIPQMYGPDGVPLDGPRTTAAEMAAQLARVGIHPGAGLYPMYRNAAAYEGDRYIEAILGARLVRGRMFAHRGHPSYYAATQIEREYGLPVGFATVLQNRGTPRAS